MKQVIGNVLMLALLATGLSSCGEDAPKTQAIKLDEPSADIATPTTDSNLPGEPSETQAVNPVEQIKGEMDALETERSEAELERLRLTQELEDINRALDSVVEKEKRLQTEIDQLEARL